MPFDFRNAPGTLQRTMEVMMFSVKWQHVLVYVDDVVVLSKTPANAIEHIRSVLALLQDANVILKLKKCEILQVLSAIWDKLLRQHDCE